MSELRKESKQKEAQHCCASEKNPHYHLVVGGGITVRHKQFTSVNAKDAVEPNTKVFANILLVVSPSH